MIEVNLNEQASGVLNSILTFAFEGNNWLVVVMLIIVGAIVWLAVTQIPTIIETFPKLNENLLTLVKAMEILPSMDKKLDELKRENQEIRAKLDDII